MKTRRQTVAIAFLIFSLAVFVRCTGFEHPAPKILLVNDDGIEAPGLAALYQALEKVGRVTVVTPIGEQSGVSHGMTSNRMITVRESMHLGGKWFGTDATPAATVRLALEVLLPEKPDIVIAGINRGQNVGLVTFYSATVAAAREAAFLGIPAISVNLQRGETMDYSAAAEFTAALVRDMAGRGFPIPKGTFLNINFPNVSKNGIKGILITRQDVRAPAEFYEKRETRDGQTFYWPSYKVLNPGAEGTDIWAVANGFISVTPLMFDQTDTGKLESLKSLEKLDWK
jgi:5'-nucleotidase